MKMLLQVIYEGIPECLSTNALVSEESYVIDVITTCFIFVQKLDRNVSSILILVILQKTRFVEIDVSKLCVFEYVKFINDVGHIPYKTRQTLDNSNILCIFFESIFQKYILSTSRFIIQSRLFLIYNKK